MRERYERGPLCAFLNHTLHTKDKRERERERRPSHASTRQGNNNRRQPQVMEKDMARHACEGIQKKAIAENKG
jgi:hypothetical protein